MDQELLSLLPDLDGIDPNAPKSSDTSIRIFDQSTGQIEFPSLTEPGSVLQYILKPVELNRFAVGNSASRLL